jgi:hypothetical protein
LNLRGKRRREFFTNFSKAGLSIEIHASGAMIKKT